MTRNSAAKIVTSKSQKEALAKMNAKHAVVSEGGRTLVLTERWDPVTKRHCVTRSSFADIRSLYQNRKVKVGKDKWTTLGDWWLRHPERRQYKGVVFVPKDEEIPGYFNLWRGFSVEPEAGDCSLYLEHMLDVICGGDDELFEYLLAWMAAGVQRPDVKPEVAIVLRSSERGTGKSIFAKYYRQLFGQHGIEISNPQHLTGKFNAHLEDCCCLVISEAFWAGSYTGESVLKTLITEDMLAIERKGVDLGFVRSYLRILMTSNAEWVVPAGLDERRFFVLDMDPKRKQDTAYFGKIAEEMENGGLAAMLYDLQRHDCSGVDLRRAPLTPALIEQKLLSLDPRERWLFDKVHEGRLLPKHDRWRPEVEKAALHEDFCRALQKTGRRRARTSTELGKFLRRMLGSKLTDTRPKKRGKRQWYWRFPSLQECRDIFDRKLGTPYDWPPPDLVSVPRSNEDDAILPMNARRKRG